MNFPQSYQQKQEYFKMWMNIDCSEETRKKTDIISRWGIISIVLKKLEINSLLSWQNEQESPFQDEVKKN